MYIFKEPGNYSFEKVGIKGKIFPIESVTASTEFVIIETESGHETVIRENGCDFSYYILEGSGVFTIEGENYPCAKSDLVVVPRGKMFTYKGTLKMLLNVTPPWREEQEETL